MFLLESAPATVDPAISEVASAAGVVGGIVAFSLTAILIFELVWLILQIVADWKIFSKADRPGWMSIIPILNTYVEYDICWSGLYGLLFMVASIVASVMSTGEGAPAWKAIIAGICAIIAVVLHIMQSYKLSKSFGHGIGMCLVLIILGPIGRIILGFGGSEYEGKD